MAPGASDTNLCALAGRGHDRGAVRVRGRWNREWLARLVAQRYGDAGCAAVVLDHDDEFVAGLAAVDGAGLVDLADHVVSDPRWLGESLRVVYVEPRERPRPSLADLARWHDLVARHAESQLVLVDWMLVDGERGTLRSMRREFGGVEVLTH